jgi:hypothetical protein
MMGKMPIGKTAATLKSPGSVLGYAADIVEILPPKD